MTSVTTAPAPAPEEMNQAIQMLVGTRKGSHGKEALLGLALMILSPALNLLIHPDWREIRGFQIWWLAAAGGALVTVNALFRLNQVKRQSHTVHFDAGGITLGSKPLIPWQDIDRVYSYRQVVETHGVTADHCRIIIQVDRKKHVLLHIKSLGELSPEANAAFETLSHGISLHALPFQKQSLLAQWGVARGYRFGWRLDAQREGLRYLSLTGWRQIAWHEVQSAEIAIRSYWFYAELFLVANVRQEGRDRRIWLGALNRIPNLRLLIACLEQQGFELVR